MQVRDLLTSRHEQQSVKQSGKSSNPTLKPDAVPVDAIVSTIGYPSSNFVLRAYIMKKPYNMHSGQQCFWSLHCEVDVCAFVYSLMVC